MNIHFIGICGSSMKVLASMCKQENHNVTGYDAKLNTGYNLTNVENADIVVYTTAVGQDNKELLYARELKKTVYERAEFLAYKSKEYSCVIAVSGTHGKTSTCAMLSCVFRNYNATAHFGGENVVELNNGKDYFITEACEFNRSFLSLSPSVGVVLNAEFDHPDTYKTQKDYHKAFGNFIKNCAKCVVYGDDPYLKAQAKLHGLVTFGFKSCNTFYAENIVYKGGKTSFTVVKNGTKICDILLPCAGEHNVINALSCVCVGSCVGVSLQVVQQGLQAFTPVKRRFESLGRVGSGVVISDYAHHPTEISYAVATAKSLNSGKIIAIFEPHTFTRTASLCSGFASSLATADSVVLMPIYPAREKLQGKITSKLIADKLALIGKTCNVFCSYDALFKYLNVASKEQCVLLFLGAGELDEYARSYVHLFKSC